jgi:hypothetical protein
MARAADVLEHGEPIAQSGTVKIVGMKQGRLVAVIPSGDYSFTSRGFTPASPPRQVAVPRVMNGKLSDDKPISLMLSCETEGATIRYTMDNTPPTEESAAYDGALVIAKSTLVRFRAFKGGAAGSFENSAEVEIHRPRIRVQGITHVTRYTPDYPVARGDSALIDREEGAMSYIDRKWVGYRANDMEVILDLGKPVPLHRISMRFVSSPKLWIFLPAAIEVSASNSGDQFVPAATAECAEPKEIYTVQTYTFPLRDVEARYVKVKAKNIGKLPDWHGSAGSDAYMFVDEIFVE